MVRPHPVQVDVGVARQDELVLLRRLLKGQQPLLAPETDAPGQDAVPGHGSCQVIHRLQDRRVKFPAPVLVEPDGEFQLAQQPADVPGGHGDVVLLLHGLTESFLVALLLPVAAHGGLQLDEIGPKIHDALSFCPR